MNVRFWRLFTQVLSISRRQRERITDHDEPLDLPPFTVIMAIQFEICLDKFANAFSKL